MNSQQNLQTIFQLVHQLKDELQSYDDAMKNEARELQFCDEFQQDLLHIIESFATSGSESASIMSQLRKNRVKRRDIKNNQKINLKSAPSIQQLRQVIDVFPSTICVTAPTYTLKTPEGLQLVNTLDAERKRTQVTFQYVEPKNKAKLSKVLPTKDKAIVCSSPTDTSIHLERNKKDWQLIKNKNNILFSNKKMQKVASYIISEKIKVYADKLAINQLTKLVEDQLQVR